MLRGSWVLRPWRNAPSLPLSLCPQYRSALCNFSVGSPGPDISERTAEAGLLALQHGYQRFRQELIHRDLFSVVLRNDIESPHRLDGSAVSLAPPVLEGAVQTCLMCQRPNSNTVLGGLCVFIAHFRWLSEAKMERAGVK